MRILVCGGRDFGNYEFLRDTLDAITKNFSCDELCIIHGGAKGADELAGVWAALNWIDVQEFKAQWGRYGFRAGSLRNQQMIDEGKPDLVVAFPGGTGTADMIKRAYRAGIDIRIIKGTP